jgi:ABC-type nitrate/sulfonate/bicarbonate transport system substrate-binding protein
MQVHVVEGENRLAARGLIHVDVLDLEGVLADTPLHIVMLARMPLVTSDEHGKLDVVIPFPHPVTSDHMHTLSIKVFPGATNLPLWVAASHGFLEERGLALDIRYTAGSVEQLTELMAGKHDVVMTLMDNVIAYADAQGEVSAAGDRDLVAFIGSDDGLPRFVVQPGIGSFEDLRGQSLSVDAMTTGLAFLLRRMLALNGISEDEVRFVAVGGVLQRWQSMMRGEHAGTLLVTPFEFMSEAQKLRVLARASDVCRSYQGNVLATRRQWAKEHSELLVAFTATYLDALDWLFAAENRRAAVELLLAHLPNMTRPVAERTCEVLLGESGGFFRDGGFDMEGVASVIALRRDYGPAGRDLREPAAYIDVGFLQRARQT